MTWATSETTVTWYQKIMSSARTVSLLLTTLVFIGMLRESNHLEDPDPIST